MMSSHINSMLEHLRIKKPSRPAVPAVVTSPDTEDTAVAAVAVTPAAAPQPAAAAVAATAAAVTNDITNGGRCPFVVPNGNGAPGAVNAGNPTADVCDNAVTSPASTSTSTAGDAGKRLSVCPDVVGGGAFDPKKRCSIPAVSAPTGAGAINGDHPGPPIQSSSSAQRPRRDLSPSAGVRHMTRKMSQDMRMLPRGSNANLSDEAFELARIRRPVKVKSILTNFETYDSLHAKATEVSVRRAHAKWVCVCVWFFFACVRAEMVR